MPAWLVNFQFELSVCPTSNAIMACEFPVRLLSPNTNASVAFEFHFKTITFFQLKGQLALRISVQMITVFQFKCHHGLGISSSNGQVLNSHAIMGRKFPVSKI